MMYQQQQPQTELEQQKLYGLIKEKINQIAQQFQIPKTMEQQIEKRAQQVAQQTRELFVAEGKQQQQQQQKEFEFDFSGMEKTTEKQELIRQVKDLLIQVKDMITYQDREEQKYPEEFRYGIDKRVQHEQELFRQIRDIQSQIDNLSMCGIEKQQEQEYCWEKRCKKPETVRRLRSVSPVRRQELKFEHEQPRFGQQPKFVQLKEQKPEMEMLSSEWRLVKEKQQPTFVKDIQPFYIEERKQLIEKLLQQVKILEEMLAEQYETMQKFSQFQFELEKQLVEQIKKQITEIEKQFAQYSFELTQYYGVEFVQKEKKIFQLVKQEIRMIEDLFISRECFETFIQMPKLEKLCKQQQQELLEKVRLFKGLVQEFFFWTQQGKQQQQQQQQPRREELLTTSTKTTTTTTTSEPVSFKLCSLLSLPLFCQEETYGKQSEKVTPLRKQLEELKIVKEELEMRLYETDRKVEQFKRQIELLEQYPQGQQYEQFRAEFPLKQTKPEAELIKICLKPQQEQSFIAQHHHQLQQQPMMVKTRSFSGKTEQQQIQPRQFF